MVTTHFTALKTLGVIRSAAILVSALPCLSLVRAEPLTISPEPVAITVRSGESASTTLSLGNSSGNQVNWRLEALDANCGVGFLAPA